MFKPVVSERDGFDRPEMEETMTDGRALRGRIRVAIDQNMEWKEQEHRPCYD